MKYYAEYYKCALQVNPYCYASYRGEQVHDEDEYNLAILKKCLENQIQVVGLANHGDIDSSESLRKCLSEAGIIVFPGFEIMTAEKIHMVCLFPEDKTTTELNKYLGACGLENADNGNATSSCTYVEIAKKVQESGGFSYAAHITSDNGILKLGKMQDIWKSEFFNVAQIPDSKENIDPDYKNIILNKDPQYHRDNPVAYINACDIENPDDLDSNVATTLIKMSSATFENFIMAFKDPDSRILLNSEEEKNYQSSIKKISVYGGYLDGLEIEFSDNLNTIIGGRGTGKSTIINLIRYALSKEPLDKERRREFNDMIDHNLGSNSRVELEIISYSHNGKQYKIIRRYKGDAVIEDMDGNVLQIKTEDILPNIEIYGQNEIVDSLREHTQVYDLVKRLFFIDQDLQTSLNSAYKNLCQNSKDILELEDEAEKDNDAIADLPSIQEKLRFYEEAGIKEKLPKLEEQAVVDGLFDYFEDEINNLADPEWPVIDFTENNSSSSSQSEILDDLNKMFVNFNEQISGMKNEYMNLKKDLTQSFEDMHKKWDNQKLIYDEEIHETLQQVEGIQDKSGTEIVTEYSNLVRQINCLEPIQNQIETRNSKLAKIKDQRKTYVEACRKCWDEYAKRLSEQVKKLNKKQFKDLIRISIQFRQYKAPIMETLKNIQGLGEKALSGIMDYKDFDVFSFAEDIRAGAETLKEKYSLTENTANKIVKFITEAQLYEIEQMELDDIYQLELLINGQFKKMENLSKGQQCTVILYILLMDNKDPLIIDQPEDNLDNAFITDSVIANIKKNKTKRQFMFSTHNANIPVFGDAELIVAMEEVEGKGRVSIGGIGSIDSSSVKEKVIDILEGGKEAFVMREKKYGLN